MENLGLRRPLLGRRWALLRWWLPTASEKGYESRITEPDNEAPSVLRILVPEAVAVSPATIPSNRLEHRLEPALVASLVRQSQRSELLKRPPGWRWDELDLNGTKRVVEWREKYGIDEWLEVDDHLLADAIRYAHLGLGWGWLTPDCLDIINFVTNLRDLEEQGREPSVEIA